MIPGYNQLVDEIDSRLAAAGISPDEVYLDHIGYRVESLAEYDKLKAEVNDAELVHENNVNGRRGVAITN